MREPQDEPNRSWSSGTKYFHATTQPKASQYTDASAPSPTAFLDMLSSAASEQIPESVNVRGFRSGASQSAMMTEASSWNPASKDSEQQPTGLTPFLSYNDSQAIDNASASIETSQGQTPDHTAEFASRRPTQYSISRLSNGGNAGSSPAPNSLLSPMNVLNFSPGPSGPNISDPAPNNLNWAPPPGPDGQIQPSNRLEGPWRSIETVDTVFQNFGNDVPSLKDPTAGLPIQQAPDVDMEGLEGIDEAVQQQLLMDLFWPGWPANLPEPHIVNELYVQVFLRQACVLRYSAALRRSSTLYLTFRGCLIVPGFSLVSHSHLLIPTFRTRLSYMQFVAAHPRGVHRRYFSMRYSSLTALAVSTL